MFIVNSQIFCVPSSICAAKGNKPLLLLLLLTMVCPKSVPASVPCHVLATCMLLHSARSLVLNCVKCGLTGGHKSSEIKSSVTWRKNSTVERARWTGTIPVHWPAGNLFKHKLREMLFYLKLCTSNNSDIGTFWWSYGEKWRVSSESQLLNLRGRPVRCFAITLRLL